MKFLIASLAAHAALIAVLVARRGPQAAATREAGSQRIAIAVAGGEGRATGDGPRAPGEARPQSKSRPVRRAAIGDPFAIAGVSVAHGGEWGTGTGTGTATGIRVETGTEGTGGSGAEPMARRPEPVASPPDVGAIRSAVQRRLRYPRAARARGVEGTVVVRFRIRPDGSVAELAVVSAADPLLAEAAREAVEEAAPFASAAGTIRLPVEFSLEAAP